MEMVLPILNTSTNEFAEAKKQSVLVFGFCSGNMIIIYTQIYISEMSVNRIFKNIVYSIITLGLTLHFPDDSQSQHKESYNKRSKGALFVLEGIGGREFFTLGSSTLDLGTYARDNLTKSLKYNNVNAIIVL